MTADPIADAAPTRRRTLLDGAWRYRPDSPEFALGEHLGWTDPDLDDGDWPVMEIPACWDIADPSLHGFEGFVWFRRRFPAPAADGRRLELCFEGANYRVDVWLNGSHLGAHEGGFTPFSFRVDGLVRPGENVLVVRVDNRPLPERVPGARLSWFNYGGLYREVFLEEQPLARLDDVWLDPLPLAAGERGPARLAAEVVVTNDSAVPFAGRLDLTVGFGSWAVTVDVASDESRTLRGEIDLAAVPYWSPEHPDLLRAEVSLGDGGGPIDRHLCDLGVRRLTVDGPRLLLNGEPVRLLGVNRHEDYPTTGRAHDERMLWNDLRAIKATGANFVRASHYPQHRRFYDACDRLGLMVMDEIPLWGWGRGRWDDGGTAPLAAARTQLDEMVRRDRNRTCVVVWSVSNETGGGRPEVDEANLDLMRRARALDPSRLVTYVALHAVWTTPDDRVMPEADILCLNEYAGSLNAEPPVPTVADLAAVRAMLGGQLDELHRRFPDKPVLMTEFGGIGLPGHHGDVPWSEEFYGATIRAHWETFAARPWIVGALLWCWQDYPMHPNRARPYPTGHYGVVTTDRRPKAAMEALTAAFVAPWAAWGGQAEPTKKDGPAGEKGKA